MLGSALLASCNYSVTILLCLLKDFSFHGSFLLFLLSIGLFAQSHGTLATLKNQALLFLINRSHLSVPHSAIFIESLSLASCFKSSLSLLSSMFFSFFVGIPNYRLHGNFLNKKVVFFHFSKAITPTKTTSKRECALGVITARRRMRYSKWAVHSVTVTKFDLIVRRLAILIVATVAEVMCAKAMPQGN